LTHERCHIAHRTYRFAGRLITPEQARREVARLERSIPWRVRWWRAKRCLRGLLYRAAEWL
jgi:hypothetical protein